MPMSEPQGRHFREALERLLADLEGQDTPATKAARAALRNVTRTAAELAASEVPSGDWLAEAEARCEAARRCSACCEHHDINVMCAPYEAPPPGVVTWVVARRRELEALLPDLPLALAAVRLLRVELAEVQEHLEIACSAMLSALQDRGRCPVCLLPIRSRPVESWVNAHATTCWMGMTLDRAWQKRGEYWPWKDLNTLRAERDLLAAAIRAAEAWACPVCGRLESTGHDTDPPCAWGEAVELANQISGDADAD